MTVSPFQLRKGDRVIVYEDPITRERPEGVATLVRYLRMSDPETGERWQVRFDDGSVVDRWLSGPVVPAAEVTP